MRAHMRSPMGRAPLNAAPPVLALPERPMGDAIPRILHQTYARTVPPELAAITAGIRAANPGWDYRFYDDDDAEAFIAEAYGPSVLALYRRINPAYGAARADLFRYLLIYHVGGIYIDMKGSFARPIDDLIRADDRFLVSRWRNGADEVHARFGIHEELSDVGGEELQQWYIAAVPGHPFLKAVIEAVLSNIARYDPFRDGSGRLGVLRVTGPIAYTKAIVPLLDRYPCRVERNEEVLGLIYSALQGSAHKRLHKKHYTLLTDPVVQLGAAEKVAYDVYRGARRVARTLLGRSHPLD